MNEDVLFTARQLNIELVFVPAGLTSQLQPLDVGINSIIKAKHSKSYREFCFFDSHIPYTADRAARELLTITQSIKKETIQKSWSNVAQAARMKLAQSSQPELMTAAHPEDVDLQDEGKLYCLTYFYCN